MVQIFINHHVCVSSDVFTVSSSISPSRWMRVVSRFCSSSCISVSSASLRERFICRKQVTFQHHYRLTAKHIHVKITTDTSKLLRHQNIYWHIKVNIAVSKLQLPWSSVYTHCRVTKNRGKILKYFFFKNSNSLKTTIVYGYE